MNDDLDEINRINRETRYLIGISFAVSIAAIVISIIGMLK